ncbi:putative ribonuclease H-like domain-containing protein [Tanacetum coccineum]
MHIKFLENKSNVVGSGPEWLFDTDSLIKSMNHEPITAENQTNGDAGIETNDNVGQAGQKKAADHEYILIPFLTSDSSSTQSSDDKDADEVPGKGDESVNKVSGSDDQERTDSSTQDINTTGTSINTASTNINTGSLNINIVSPNDPNMPSLEETGIFDGAYDDEDVGAEADLNNLETTMNVSPIPTTRIHKDHPKDQIIGDLNLSSQTRRMINFSKENAMVIQALTDPSWIEAMQEELLQFKFQKVWTLVDLPKGKRAVGTKWVYRNKKDERGIVVRNKARLIAQGYTQEEGIDYDEVFASVARIEAIRLFLAYASFMGLIVYQMDVKSAFLYGTIEEEVYVYQPPGFEDPQFPDKVYKVYVDDIIFGSIKKSLCVEFEQMMHRRFQLSSIRELTFFLGLQLFCLFVDMIGDGISDEFGVKTGSCKVNAARQDLVLLGAITIVATQHQKTHKPRRAKRSQDTKIPQSSGPPKKVSDEAFYIREDDIVVRAATTASSLKTEQESYAQTRFETASKKSHDPPLLEVAIDVLDDAMEIVKVKATDLMYIYQELAQRLSEEEQAQFEKEQRIARKKSVEHEAKDASLIEQMEDVQARMDADELLAERLQQEEREQFTVDEQARMLVDLIVEKKKFFDAHRGEQIRNKPPTIAQLRNKMVTYVKHMGNYTYTQLKSKSFEEIQNLYENEQKWINDFVSLDSDMVKDSGKKDGDSQKQTESSKKRPSAKHDEESVKKQKLEDEAEREDVGS